MRLRLRTSPHTVVVVARPDRLGERALDGLAGQVRAAIDAGSRLVVIELGAVTHIDNARLSRLCVTRRGFGGARIRVSGADARVRRVLTLCAIDGLQLSPAIEARAVQRLPDIIRSARVQWRRALTRRLDFDRSPSGPFS